MALVPVGARTASPTIYLGDNPTLEVEGESWAIFFYSALSLVWAALAQSGLFSVLGHTGNTGYHQYLLEKQLSTDKQMSRLRTCWGLLDGPPGTGVLGQRKGPSDDGSSLFVQIELVDPGTATCSIDH